MPTNKERIEKLEESTEELAEMIKATSWALKTLTIDHLDNMMGVLGECVKCILRIEDLLQMDQRFNRDLVTIKKKEELH